jgi:dihydrolipoamide dehydrogenase
MKAACVDKRPTAGGTCLNVGCIPSKALLESSELYAQARGELARHGIGVGTVQLDLAAMLARKDRVVKGLTEGVAFLLKKNRVVRVQGMARLSGRGQVVVRPESGPEQVLEAERVLLATGSEPSGLASVPLDGRHIVSSTEALAFDKVPEHLIVVGGGYIGLELGSVWSRLGAKVSVLEFLPRILPQADQEIAAQLHRALRQQGLAIEVETQVRGARVEGDGVEVTAIRQGAEQTCWGERVLVAVGRRPCTAGLGLEELGVRREERSGRVLVDEDYQTTVPGIYAIGDLVDGPMLAHKAEDDGIACVERWAGMKTHVNYAMVPSVVYTWPEVASVGATEEQLREQGREYRVGRFPFSANARARCLDATEGLVKVLADARTDRVLGVHIVGPRASELIAECTTIMEFSGSAEDIARICHAHPTLSEAVREAALAVDGRAIHI